jgi:hypothetical protein
LVNGHDSAALAGDQPAFVVGSERDHGVADGEAGASATPSATPRDPTRHLTRSWRLPWRLAFSPSRKPG